LEGWQGVNGRGLSASECNRHTTDKMTGVLHAAKQYHGVVTECMVRLGGPGEGQGVEGGAEAVYSCPTGDDGVYGAAWGGG